MRFLEPEDQSDTMRLWRVRLEDLPRNSANLEMSRFSVAVGGETPLDSHIDSEVWMFASGRGVLSFCGDCKMDVSAGDVVRFFPFESHTLKNTGEKPLLVFSVWWKA